MRGRNYPKPLAATSRARVARHWRGSGARRDALWEAQDGLKYLNPHLLRLQPLITTERASEREPHKGGQIIKPSRIRNHTRDSPMAVALQRARICTRMESTHSHTHTPHHLACTFSRLPIPSRCVSVCVCAPDVPLTM